VAEQLVVKAPNPQDAWKGQSEGLGHVARIAVAHRLEEVLVRQALSPSLGELRQPSRADVEVLLHWRVSTATASSGEGVAAGSLTMR
jgi:hypothetical protein